MNQAEKLISRSELETRLQKELAQPFYQAKMLQQYFTETEYQEIKSQLTKDWEKYIEDYIDPQEN